MKTRERGFVGVVGESGQSAAYNDPLRETSGKLHSARRRDPARSSCSLRRVERRAKNVAFWPRKGKASFVIEAHRASCKTAEFQRRYAIRRAAQTYIYGIYLLGWKADTWPGCSPRPANCARVTRHSSPNKWTMFQERS